MPEYVVLIVGDADRWWTTMDADQRAAGYAEYTRFGEELSRRGHTITGGAELHSTSTEQVGGFYQVRTDDLDDLVDCCRIIAALGDTVEVRRTVSPEDRA